LLVFIVADDILIFGRTRKEHDSNIEAMFKHARQIGLRLNNEKSDLLQDELPYIGHIMAINVLKPNPNKVNIILKMKPTSYPQGVKLFFGHITYLSKIINSPASRSEPLWRLLTDTRQCSRSSLD